MQLNETYSRACVGKHLSDMFLIYIVLKPGYYLLPLLFNLVIEYAIWRVQVNQDSFKLKCTHQLLAYAPVDNTLGGSIYTTQENTEVLVVGSKETGLEVKAEKTMYMVMSRDKNAGPSHNIKTDNKSFEMMEQLKYLGKNLMHQYL